MSEEFAVSENFWALVFVWVVVFGVLCGAITSSKGKGFLQGAILGGCLGIIGLIIVLAEKPKTTVTSGGLEVPQRECPFCRQRIRADASVCRYCQRESSAWTYHQGYWWTQNEGVWFRLNPSTRQWELPE